MSDSLTGGVELTPAEGLSSRARKIARGTLWGWSEVFSTGALAIFVSPYVVHHLGNSAYGVWVLINAVVSYLIILDLGVRGAVVRFVSADQPRGLHAEASHAVSAALWFRFWLGTVVIVATVGLAIAAPRVFNIPPELHSTTRVAIVLSGINVVMSLIFGVFSGVLNALHRFDLIGVAGIGQAFLTAAGIVSLLGLGRGIAAMALWQLIVGLACGVFLYKAVRRVYPQLTLRLRSPGRELVRKFGSYSLFVFLNVIAFQVIYYTDNMVIGAALPISAVTFYALGYAPTQYLKQVISSIGVTFLPTASNLAAHGEHEQLRRLLIQGTKLIMAVALAIEVGLFVRGSTFISLWMGAQYREVSGRVLQILTVSWFFMAGNSCAANIIYGLSKHKPLAIGAMLEAVANLVLSIVLVRRWGVVGVAWGTTLPSLLMNVFVWPRYVAKLLDIPLPRYLMQSWVRPIVAIIPFAVACLLAERWWPVTHLAGFFLQMVALLPLAVAGLALMFRREISTVLLTNNWWPRLQAIWSHFGKS